MSTYIIWKERRGTVIDRHSEVVGLFHGTHEEADKLLDYLNKNDDEVIRTWGDRIMYGYWRSEPSEITAKNAHEYVPH